MSKKYIPMEENKDVTPEEDTAQVAPNESDVREKIINEYGFDEIDDADRIEKLTARELEQQKKLSAAIGQKIKLREQLKAKEEPEIKAPDSKAPASQSDTEDLDKKLDEKLNERLEKRELDSLDYPDDLKDEIQKIAKVRGVSIKEAQRDPYIVYRVEDFEKEQKTDEATLQRTNKKGGKKVYTLENPPEVDFSTEEGRKEWEDYKAAMKKAGH